MPQLVTSLHLTTLLYMPSALSRRPAALLAPQLLPMDAPIHTAFLTGTCLPHIPTPHTLLTQPHIPSHLLTPPSPYPRSTLTPSPLLHPTLTPSPHLHPTLTPSTHPHPTLTPSPEHSVQWRVERLILDHLLTVHTLPLQIPPCHNSEAEGVSRRVCKEKPTGEGHVKVTTFEGPRIILRISLYAS